MNRRSVRSQPPRVRSPLPALTPNSILSECFLMPIIFLWFLNFIFPHSPLLIFLQIIMLENLLQTRVKIIFFYRNLSIFGARFAIFHVMFISTGSRFYTYSNSLTKENISFEEVDRHRSSTTNTFSPFQRFPEEPDHSSLSPDDIAFLAFRGPVYQHFLSPISLYRLTFLYCRL